MLVDTATLEYLNSTAPQPTQAALDSLLRLVSAVRVHEGGNHGGKVFGTKILLETDVPNDIALLCDALKIVERPSWHCMCYGGPTLELLTANRSQLALLGVHHGFSIRWDHWKDDAVLADGHLLLEWLAQRGVNEPLREFEASQVRQAEGQRNLERWLKAMPEALLPIRAEVLGEYGIVNLAPLQTALERGLPDETLQILALLKWFGSGSGPWSGCPAYEKSAEDLLLLHSTERIVSAIQSSQLSKEQLEGAARFFAGWTFNRTRKNGLQELPEDIKKLFWEHVKDTHDDDNRSRATRAFVGT
jgi:hypothetical protein